MSAFLSFFQKVLVWADSDHSTNPKLKYVDWDRQQQSVSVQNPRSSAYVVSPGETLAVFNGERSLAIDGTTVLTLTANTIEESRYRISWTSGANPVFRTNRSVNLTGISTAVAIQANGVVTVTAGSGTPFSSVIVGDQVFIPGTTTGDGSTVFSVLNQGQWTVIGATSTALSLTRPTGTEFQASGETVTPTAIGQFVAYSSAGLQVGDKIDISAGFASNVQKTYQLLLVTASFIEFSSSLPLAAESASPGAAGFKAYSSCKRFVWVECDQEGSILCNGDTGSYQKMQPWEASDATLVATYVRTGPTFSLSIKNSSVSPMNVSLTTVE